MYIMQDDSDALKHMFVCFLCLPQILGQYLGPWGPVTFQTYHPPGD